MCTSWTPALVFTAGLLFATGTTPIPARAQDFVCVHVRDGVTKRPLVHATLRADAGATRDVSKRVWTDSAGRACWTRSDASNASQLRVEGLGYRGVDIQFRASDTLRELSLERVVIARGNSPVANDAAWRREQILFALARAHVEADRCATTTIASCARSFGVDTEKPSDIALADEASSVVARGRLAESGVTLLEDVEHRLAADKSLPPQALRETAGVTLVAYVDVPDSSARYTEVRVGIPAGIGRASLGVTDMLCRGKDCERGRQLSVTWAVDDDRALTPELAMVTNGSSRAVDIFDLSAAHEASLARADASGAPRNDAALATEAPNRSTRGFAIRGIVRDEKGRPIAQAEVLASPGDRDTRTDSTGRYILPSANEGGRATLLTARAIGFAPAYHTAIAGGDSVVTWEPRLRSVQMLAERIVRVSGLPPRLSSWRYDEFMARRAKGRGQFLIGEEIWSASALGDALGRVPGVTVKMGRAFTIENIRVARCELHVGDRTIGVWIDGYEQTRARPYQEVLSEIAVSEVIGIEIYRNMSEIPGEYADPRYCAAFALWTK